MSQCSASKGRLSPQNRRIQIFRHSRESGNPVLHYQFIVQIFPIWIAFLNQVQFPLPVPFFYLFLSGNCCFCRSMHLIPNQTMNSIFLRKTVSKIVSVFVNTLNQVRRDPRIKRTISFTAQHINNKLFHYFSAVYPSLFHQSERRKVKRLDSRFRGNDVLSGCSFINAPRCS